MGCRVVSLRGSEISGEGVLELGAIVALTLPPVGDADVLRPHPEGLEVARQVPRRLPGRVGFIGVIDFFPPPPWPGLCLALDQPPKQVERQDLVGLQVVEDVADGPQERDPETLRVALTVRQPDRC